MTDDALLDAVNRRLRPRYERLCRSYPYEIAMLGEYHLLDTWRRHVIGHHLDLHTVARRLGLATQ